MKTPRFNYSIFALLVLALSLNSCRDKVLRTYEANVPVYQSLEEWRQTEFTLEGAREIKRPGKIYVWGQYLIVNDILTGVHFFDNSNPAAPVNLGFLPVLANSDIAVYNNVMYLDSYYDLLAFDISDVRNPQLQSRVTDIFDFIGHGAIDSYNFDYPAVEIDTEKGVVIAWKVEETTESVMGYNPWTSGRSEFGVKSDVAQTGGNASTANFAAAGIGGSMARFTIWQHFLYTLQTNQLDVFDLNAGLVRTSTTAMTSECETLFPAEGRLYIGTTTGMLIYDLVDPATPSFITNYEHLTACDPVVVQGNRAYVTLRSGNNCWNNVNRLEVIDLSNISNPTLMHWFPMTNPRGLGLDDDLLFLCDGPSGLKIFDKSNPSAIPSNQISHFPNIETNDVIPVNGTLIMTSEQGIFQYDYSDPNNIIQLSHLPVAQ